VQELLGHADVSTTMIYIHVLGRPNVAVKSPLEADIPGFSQRIHSTVGTPQLQGVRFDSRLAKLPPLVSEHSTRARTNDLREYFSEHHRSATSGTMKAQIPSPGKLSTSGLLSITDRGPAPARRVANRQILYRWLPAGRLRVKLHQVQHVFGHVASHRQPELARPLERDRIIMRPCATRQQFGKLRRLFGGILVSEQLAHLVFHLRHGFFGLISQNQVWSSTSAIGFRRVTWMIEAAGYWPNCGSTGPNTACSQMTISSAASAISVPPDMA
jgi:hypothetical protein